MVVSTKGSLLDTTTLTEDPFSTNATGDGKNTCSRIFTIADTETSFTSRDGNDTTRHTVNTHTSILNITEDDEEEDEENADINHSFLFSDLHEEPPSELQQKSHRQPQQHQFVPGTPESVASTHWCEVAPNSNELCSRQGSSVFDVVTERLVESLCIPRDKDVKEDDKGMTWDGYRRMIEYDILELLGCSYPPDDNEMEKIWAWNQSLLFCHRPQDHVVPTPPRPRRRTLRERTMRIHRVKADRSAVSITHGSLFSPAPSPTSVVDNRVKSFDDYGLERRKKGAPDVTQFLATDTGYDSDPGEVLVVPSPQLPSSRFSLPPRPSRSPPPINTVRVVHEAFNANWLLTWHPANNPEFPHQPTSISAWLERGTVLGNNSVMLEPSLMWRETYQPSLQHRVLNESSKKPYSIRLLNLCRVLEAPMDLDRSVYPFARANYCIMLRTINREEFLFEAASIRDRNEIVQSWKLVVARFASLAVLEDLDGIFDEFINPMAASPMLVPKYDQLDES